MAEQQRVHHWTDLALCKGKTELFFGHRGDWKSSKLARDICSECPVASRCLEEAVKNDERYGVWGGVTYTERRKVNQKTRGPVEHGTRSSYCQGCRCADCREAQRLYSIGWRERKRSGSGS